MSSYSVGRQAEQRVANYLAHAGYEVLCKNWRTRYCEIDIVASHQKVVYFVEVKYRRTGTWGSGVDYITPSKLRQMALAARFWVAHNNWSGDCRLAVFEVSGSAFNRGRWLPL